MTDLRGVDVKDQASELRRLVASSPGQPIRKVSKTLRSFAVVGGKGGVGKSNIAINLALAMGSLGKNTALLDGDLGLANADILLGVRPSYNLIHFIRGEKTLDEVMFPVGDKVVLIPGGTGISELANMDGPSQSLLIDRIGDLEHQMDVMVIDTGAGIHENMIRFALAADTVILITTPEPTSIRDAYGLLKSLVFSSAVALDVRILVNMANSKEEARTVSNRMRFAADQFLRMDLGYIGYVPMDPKVTEAVRSRKPLLRLFPNSPAAVCIRSVAMNLTDIRTFQDSRGRGVKSFFLRLSRRLGLNGERG